MYRNWRHGTNSFNRVFLAGAWLAGSVGSVGIQQAEQVMAHNPAYFLFLAAAPDSGHALCRLHGKARMFRIPLLSVSSDRPGLYWSVHNGTLTTGCTHSIRILVLCTVFFRQGPLAPVQSCLRPCICLPGSPRPGDFPHGAGSPA